jgi:DNA-binding transcriptional LysR family regulator
MELRHFRYFIAVAEELHFSRAAERLHIAQSALSQQILSLESELGISLFYRTKRQVQLTTAGEAFLEDARSIIAQVRQATERSQRVARGEIGQLRIGFTILSLHSVLPPIFQSLRQSHPGVQLILNEMTTQAQLNALQAKQIDVGFLHPPVADNTLEIVDLKAETMWVVLPSEHPLAHRQRLSLRSLCHSPLIIHPRHEGVILYDQILQLYASIDCQPTIVQEAMTSPTRIGLVAAGLGITFVPQSLCALHYPGVVYKKLSDAMPKLAYAIAWQRDNKMPLIHHFRTLNKHQKRVEF